MGLWNAPVFKDWQPRALPAPALNKQDYMSLLLLPLDPPFFIPLKEALSTFYVVVVGVLSSLIFPLESLKKLIGVS